MAHTLGLVADNVLESHPERRLNRISIVNRFSELSIKTAAEETVKKAIIATVLAFVMVCGSVAGQESLSEFQRLAEQGAAEAQFSLGFAYDIGDGVMQDSAKAIEWYRKAAEQNHVRAQFSLGVAYDIGDGVPQNSAEAAEWYRKAAEQNFARAQFSLAIAYDVGEGVKQNSGEAVNWYRKSAEQGYPVAQYILGIKYYVGQDIPKDVVEAHKWINLAAANGYAGAMQELEELQWAMTQDQIEMAQRRANEWTENRNSRDAVANGE